MGSAVCRAFQGGRLSGNPDQIAIIRATRTTRTRRRTMILPVVLLSAAVSGTAPAVYKCEEGGAITYTDRPCSPTATAHELPGLIVTAPPSTAERALARAHDERAAREVAERDKADAAWLKRHGEERAREDKV